MAQSLADHTPVDNDCSMTNDGSVYAFLYQSITPLVRLCVRDGIVETRAFGKAGWRDDVEMHAASVLVLGNH